DDGEHGAEPWVLVVQRNITADAQFTASSFVKQPDGLYHGSLKVKNISAEPLDGALSVALLSLPSGVTLSSASVTLGGVKHTLKVTKDAAGHTLVVIPKSLLPALLPGQSVTLALAFKDPLGKTITFTPRLFSNPFAP